MIGALIGNLFRILFDGLIHTVSFPLHVFTRRDFGVDYFAPSRVFFGFFHIVLLTSTVYLVADKPQITITFLKYIDLPQQQMFTAFFTTWQGLLYVAYFLAVIVQTLNQGRFVFGHQAPNFNGYFIFRPQLSKKQLRIYKNGTEPLFLWLVAFVVLFKIDNNVLVIWLFFLAFQTTLRGLTYEKTRHDDAKENERGTWRGKHRGRTFKETRGTGKSSKQEKQSRKHSQPD